MTRHSGPTSAIAMRHACQLCIVCTRSLGRRCYFMFVAQHLLMFELRRSSLTDAGLGLVGPTPRGKERQVAPSLASFRASAVANNTNRSSRLCYVSATTFRALPSGRDRFTALSASTCPCDAIATNRGYPSPWFDLLLVIKALSPYPAATPANSNLSLYVHSFR